jgi:hypothetical protein
MPELVHGSHLPQYVPTARIHQKSHQAPRQLPVQSQPYPSHEVTRPLRVDRATKYSDYSARYDSRYHACGNSNCFADHHTSGKSAPQSDTAQLKQHRLARQEKIRRRSHGGNRVAEQKIDAAPLQGTPDCRRCQYQEHSDPNHESRWHVCHNCGHSSSGQADCETAEEFRTKAIHRPAKIKLNSEENDGSDTDEAPAQRSRGKPGNDRNRTII